MLRGVAVAAAAAMLIAAAPAAEWGPVPAGSQTALVRRYVDALAARRYGTAFALLEPAARAYFRTPAHFASSFVADDFSILRYRLTGSRGDARFRVYVARENVRVRDPARDRDGTATVDVPYGVRGSGANARVKDLGRPWKAYALGATASVDALRVTVKKIAFYDKHISLVVTFANYGDSYVTVLPYGRSALRDNLGHFYRPAVRAVPARAAQRLLLGVHLAANEQITGSLDFAAAHVSGAARRFTLTAAPNVRDGADVPFSVDVSHIDVPA
jgi:hypothetical protein